MGVVLRGRGKAEVLWLISRKHARAPLLLLLTVLFVSSATGLRFYLHDRERRCFKFDAPYGTRVIGHRSIANGKGNAELSIEVKSPSGKVVFESHSGDPKHTNFAFMTPDFSTDHPDPLEHDEYDYDPQDTDATFAVCLVLALDSSMHTGMNKRAVSFWMRADALGRERRGDSLASDDSVGKVHTLLQEMGETLRGLVSDLEKLQQRETRLVKRTEATSQRLRLFAAVAIVVLVCTSWLQFMHFKTFFKAKKLL